MAFCLAVAGLLVNKIDFFLLDLIEIARCRHYLFRGIRCNTRYRVTVVMYDGSVATRPTDMYRPSPWGGVWLAAFLWEDYQ